MRRSLVVPLVLLVPFLLTAAACGDGDDGGAIVADEGSGGAGDGSGGSDAGGGITIDPMPAGDPNDPSTLPATDDPDAPVTDDGNAGSGEVPTPAPGTGDARIVNPTPGLLGVVATALDSAIRRDGDKVEARFYGGVVECHGVDHVDIVESPTDVTITVFTGTPPEAAARACIEIAELQAVIVALDAPLGDRVVIDGSSGAEVPLS